MLPLHKNAVERGDHSYILQKHRIAKQIDMLNFIVRGRVIYAEHLSYSLRRLAIAGTL